MQNPRQIAFISLREVYRGAYSDVALDRALAKSELAKAERRLVTELVYGSVRRMRSLDALIDQLGKKKAAQQPPDLRVILHLGLYQLCYLNIPQSAAVNTTVDLAKENGFAGLAGFVNGLLRQYIRLQERGRGEEGEGDGGTWGLGDGGREEGGERREEGMGGLGDEGRREERGERGGLGDGGRINSSLTQNLELKTQNSLLTQNSKLKTHNSIVEHLGILYSYPDWMVELWLEQFGFAETEKLCEWMNHPPSIDLRINTLCTSIEEVETAIQGVGVEVSRVPHLPQALRLTGSTGAIQKLPGFSQGWWTVQDSSAQLVSYLLDPKPGEVVIDACAAPGGKTTHIAELIGDEGTVWACDKTASRLRKLKENVQRLNLKSIQICTGDSRNLSQFTNSADRVLLDAPCSGLGTLHRHADARWRQTSETVKQLSILQGELLEQVATWVKPGGILVYATCTLHPLENESVIQTFLAHHPSWQIDFPLPNSPAAAFTTSAGWIKVLPHQHQMDGFFMVRLQRKQNS